MKNCQMASPSLRVVQCVMPARSPRPLATGPIVACRSPVVPALLAGCAAAALLSGCVAAQSEGEPRLAQGQSARCSVESPRVNGFERLDPLSSFSPAGGYLGNPTVKPYRGFFALPMPPAPPREEPDGVAEFRLTAKPVVAPGELLDLKLHVLNRSPRAITVMHPSIGGECSPTFAYYDLYLRPENEHRAFKYAYANVTKCQSRGPLEADAFLDVDAGASASFDMHENEPSGLAGLRLFSPGRYVLWSVYRFCGLSNDDLSCTHAAPLTGEYASNSVTIEVR